MQRRFPRSAALAGGLLALAAAASPGRCETQLERGKYLAAIMDCGGCHTTGNLVGQPDRAKYLAGSDVGWLLPNGVVYPSNITPDAETGIGSWSEDDLVKALKTGLVPGGRVLAPLMPWPAYSHASDADLHALAAFLKQIPAVRHAVPGPTPVSDVKTPYITVAPAPSKP